MNAGVLHGLPGLPGLRGLRGMAGAALLSALLAGDVAGQSQPSAPAPGEADAASSGGGAAPAAAGDAERPGVPIDALTRAAIERIDRLITDVREATSGARVIERRAASFLGRLDVYRTALEVNDELKLLPTHSLAAGVAEIGIAGHRVGQTAGFVRPLLADATGDTEPAGPEWDGFLATVAQSNALVDRQVERIFDEVVVELSTGKGRLVVELYPDVAPQHVQNFVDLARADFYDDLVFHRVIPGLLVQGGCPAGDGTGGPGHTLRAEFSDRPHERGTLSMARQGHPDSAGSQFFLCLDRVPDYDGKYTVFGHLLSGEETLDAIAATGDESGIPSERVVIEDVTVRRRRPEEAR